MKTKKYYNTPSMKVIEIGSNDIIATSGDISLYFDPTTEEDGIAQ